MFRLIFLLLFVLIWQTAKTQGTSTFMGARAYALGNTTSCLHDEWSIVNNVAGLATVKETTAAFSCLARPYLKSANKSAFVFVTPIQLTTIGIGVFHFGDNLYSENVASLGFARKIGITSVGIKINYLQFNAEGFGSKGVLSGSVGVITQLTSILSIGAHIVNVTQPKISVVENEKLATVLIVGTGLNLTKEVFITSELEKNLNQPTLIKAGLEYQFHEKFFFRTGFTLNPNAGFVGIGFKSSKLRFDYGYRYEPNLGSSHQASVSYRFTKQIVAK